MEIETTNWSKFSNAGKATVEQILQSKERNKCERANCTKSRILAGKSIIWVRLFEIEKLWYSSPGLSVLLEYASKAKDISRWVD